MKRILSHSLFSSAEKYPQNIAFKQHNQSISYEELTYKSNSLANFLLDIGVAKGDRIGILMNRSLESAYSVYGIFSAGAAYVPIDSNLPINRIKEIILDCEIKVIISNNQFKDKVVQLGAENTSLEYIIGIDQDASDDTKVFSWTDILSFKKSSPSVSLAETDIAYIMYTSGTTGHPKGIVHTHFSGYSYAKLSAELYSIDSNDILGNHSHLHFDISTLGYLTMPSVGGCTILVPEAHTLFPTSLSKLIEAEKMTIWYSVPLALIQMLQSGSLADKDLSHLKWVLFGGEPFAVKHIKELFKFLPEATFSNVYGPAEVNQCTYYNFNKDTKLQQPLSLGNAWPETKVKILEGEESGKEGELLVASSTQMKEYWNQPTLTDKCFITEKDSDGVEQRYYKTGDIVKLLDSGDLVFLGRSDRQIKVRGHRVELNEIENTLIKNNDILEAAVYSKRLEDAWAIFADVVGNGKMITQSEIKKYLSTLLPHYAMPMEIRITDSIPRTNAGKVDYKSLAK